LIAVEYVTNAEGGNKKEALVEALVSDGNGSSTFFAQDLEAAA
jgi:hypothetical protein